MDLEEYCICISSIWFYAVYMNDETSGDNNTAQTERVKRSI